jgi:hypothetical protein
VCHAVLLTLPPLLLLLLPRPTQGVGQVGGL